MLRVGSIASFLIIDGSIRAVGGNTLCTRYASAAGFKQQALQQIFTKKDRSPSSLSQTMALYYIYKITFEDV